MFIGFLLNLVLRFALMSPLSVLTFHPIGEHIHVLWWIFAKFVNRRKNKEKNPNFGCLYVSQKWLDQFSSYLECGLPYLGDHGAYKKCENHIFFLPVNILTVWRAGFLGRMTYRASRSRKYCSSFVVLCNRLK